MALRSLFDAQLRRVMDQASRTVEETAKRSLFDPAKRGVLAHRAEGSGSVTSVLSADVPWKKVHLHKFAADDCPICDRA